MAPPQQRCVKCRCQGGVQGRSFLYWPCPTRAERNCVVSIASSSRQNTAALHRILMCAASWGHVPTPCLAVENLVGRTLVAPRSVVSILAVRVLCVLLLRRERGGALLTVAWFYANIVRQRDCIANAVDETPGGVGIALLCLGLPAYSIRHSPPRCCGLLRCSPARISVLAGAHCS